MTEEELVGLYGLPTGRFVAPENPFGIAAELVFVSELAVVQTLMDTGGAIRYFAATATDFDLKLRSPVVLGWDESGVGKPNRYFVLNETPLGEFTSRFGNPLLFGGLGASWLNFGLVGGGSHADNWRYYSVGLHSRGNETNHGEPVDPAIEPGNTEFLRQALLENPLGHHLHLDDPEKFEQQLLRECEEDLKARHGIADPEISRWITKACGSSALLPPANQSAIRSSSAWSTYLARGTADTFATTSPNLFDRFPAEVFYGIWGLGPSEGSLP